ncbi:MAG: UDP-4-amino-4,6-dideoxy-N-acetyl-beta-L-altrosamine transaminase [Oscillospiraceae bacterium]|nr:UDP-4-amino-4,6-dideoxy-N-acetyl-beta-L-altrosamine transaminase [Oscillospiraceae bacterium]
MNTIYYGRQYIDEDDCTAVREVLLSDYLTTGPKPRELEQRLCELTGAEYAISIANGTAALHAACFAAGIGAGDEVITTPMTFVASANCVLYCGGKPVFADIEADTYNISPKSVEALITPNTKAVIAVDFTGQAARYNELRDICERHGLVLIGDAAHSIGTKYNGKAIGNVADITTFSFHPVKTVTGGEGGAVLTNNKGYYDKLMLFRTHGITREHFQMISPTDDYWYYEQVELGYNYRLTDFQAALIISQLNKLDMFTARRREIVKRYNEAFSNMPEIIIQQEIPQSDTVRHLYIIQLNYDFLKCARREFFDAMFEKGIVCNVHYIPVYFHPYYERLGYKKGLCPVAERVYEGVLTLPLYYSLSDDDVERVITEVKKAVMYFRKPGVSI